MREPWHVLNVKRRVAELAPISKSAFEEHAPTRPQKSPREESIEPSEDDSTDDKGQGSQNEDESPSQCLFCPSRSLSVKDNLSHMLVEHSFFISQPEHLVDAESFLGYLRTVITTSHECLYCGTTRSTTEDIRQHMRDKGHCLLNVDAEPELLEFWEFLDSSGGEDGESEAAAAFVARERDIPIFQKLSDKEIRLPRGTIIGSRSGESGRKLNRKRRAAVRAAKVKMIEAVPAEEQPAQPSISTPSVRDSRVAVRGELGMVGVTDQQKRALMAVEKKAQKQEEVIRASYRWSVEKTANKQKRYRRIVAKKGCVPMNAHLM